ncbi:MAG: DNA-binding protein [Acetobacteraceae bacterium]
MTDAPPVPDYGTTRNRRPSVTYGEFERAADALLAAGDKPGLENVRKAIGGSPETIRQMLRRYWTDVAALKRSPAEALMRLPSEVADLADELWQRSLALAAQSATHDDNAARERLEEVKRENELRSDALAVKERALREREETRDKTMRELQEQVATLLSIVSRNTETISALQAGKAQAEATAENYRRRLAQVIARAVLKNQKAGAPRASITTGRRSPPRAKAPKGKSKGRPVARGKPHTKLLLAARRRPRR